MAAGDSKRLSALSTYTPVGDAISQSGLGFLLIEVKQANGTFVSMKIDPFQVGGAGGAGAFSELTGMIALGQIPNNLITEAKLSADIKAKLNKLVISDPTLTGDGSTSNPLKVAIPYTQAEKNKLFGLTATDLPTGASSPVRYSPSVIYHDPNRVQGNFAQPLSTVIAQVEANNNLYTQRQTGSFVSATNFNPLTVETVSYGNISAKALVVTYNGNLFEDQQLIKFELIDSTGELTKEYLFPPETIRNGFDYVVSDALQNSSQHKKEVRFRIVYNSGTNKTKIYIHQRPVSDPPPAVYLFIIALYKVESLSQKGEKGDSIIKGLFNINTVYQAGDIFYFDGTEIQVRPNTTFQASVDHPTWSEQTWRSFLFSSSNTGAKIQALTHKGTIFDAVRTGNNLVIDYDDGRPNKNISLSADLAAAFGLLAGSKITNNTIAEAKLDATLRAKINANPTINFNQLAGSLGLSQVPDNLLTEQKLNQAVRTKLNKTYAESFIDLSDTPNVLVAGKWIKVNSTGTQFIFVDEPTGSGGVGTSSGVQYKNIFFDKTQDPSLTSITNITSWQLQGAATSSIEVGTSQPTPPDASGGYKRINIAITHADWSKADQVEISMQRINGSFFKTLPRFLKSDFDSPIFYRTAATSSSAPKAFSLTLHRNQNQTGTTSSTTHRLEIQAVTGSGNFIIGNVRLVTDSKGQKGDTGDTGPRGLQGAMGLKGDKGADGVIGPIGPIGPVGPMGRQGATGAKGDKGDQGIRGLQGLRGATGAIGPAGPAGTTLFSGLTDKLTNNNITDNTISGNKLQDNSIQGRKLQSNSVTNSKVANGIAGSKITNLPESSLSTAVQTKLNASGGGGSADLASDSEFTAGTDTKAPTVNQSKNYTDSKDPFLVLWEGQFGNAGADNVMTLGSKASISGLNEYDSTNDRMTITKGGGSGNNTLIEWENPNIDARRVTFLSELTMNTANWTMSAQIGYLSLAAGDNALEEQLGGWGFLCTRSSIIIGSGDYFGLSLFVGQGGSLGRPVAPREMAQSQVDLRGGALAPNGNNPYIRLPYNTTTNRVTLYVERIGRLFRVYSDGILRAVISLNDNQASVTGRSGKFSYAGNPANTPSIRYYLYKSAVGNTVLRPLSGAVPSGSSSGGGASSFSDLTGTININQIANSLITEAKLNASVVSKLNATYLQNKGNLNFSTTYQAGEIFEYNGTQIQVKNGQTFRAVASGSLSWNDGTWKTLINQVSGGLRTKLRPVSFIDALTTARISGNNIIFGRANEVDLTLALPVSSGGSGSVDITGKDLITTLQNEDEFLISEKGADGSVTLTAGSSGNLIGWNTLQGTFGLLSSTVTNIKRIIFDGSDNKFKVYGMGFIFSDILTLTINGESISLSRGSDLISVGFSSFYSYEGQSTQNNTFVNGEKYQIKILKGSEIILGSAPASSVLKKTTLGQLKGELGKLNAVVHGGTVDVTSVPAASDINDVDGLYVHRDTELSLPQTADGFLYGFKSSGVPSATLFNLSTYAQTDLADSGSNYTGLRSVFYHKTRGKYYGIEGTSLYEINFISNSKTLVSGVTLGQYESLCYDEENDRVLSTGTGDRIEISIFNMETGAKTGRVRLTSNAPVATGAIKIKGSIIYIVAELSGVIFLYRANLSNFLRVGDVMNLGVPKTYKDLTLNTKTNTLYLLLSTHNSNDLRSISDNGNDTLIKSDSNTGLSGIYYLPQAEANLVKSQKTIETVTLPQAKNILTLDYQTILTPEYLKASPNTSRDEIRLTTDQTGVLGIGTDANVDVTVNTAGYRTINIAVKKTDMVGVKFVEVFHAHAPQALATSSGLKRLSDYDSTPKPFSGTFRSDRNYSMSIHRGQNQLGGNSSTTDRISFTSTTSGVVYIGEIRIWK